MKKKEKMLTASVKNQNKTRIGKKFEVTEEKT